MDSKVSFAVSVIVVLLLVGGFLVATQLGAPSKSEQSSSMSTSTTTGTSGSSQGLQLQLSVAVSYSGGPDGNVTVGMTVDEYNTLPVANNVSKSDAWGLQGLSLGPCGIMAYPFGVAIYQGLYTAGNVSQAKPLDIYPAVACPMYIRLVTGYLFQPTSDLAAILPGAANATTPMSANVTASALYSMAPPPPTSSTSLGPGTYTVAAGDEWGAVVLVHFTVGAGPSTSFTTTGAEADNPMIPAPG